MSESVAKLATCDKGHKYVVLPFLYHTHCPGCGRATCIWNGRMVNKQLCGNCAPITKRKRGT